MARTNETRASEAREADYSPPNELDIPQDVEDSFASKGYKLRWVNYTLSGEDNFRNISRRLKEGWVFVTKDELSEHVASMYEVRNTKGNKGLITVGDLALAKLPIEKVEARSRYYVNAAVEKEASLLNEYKGNNSRLNQILPILNESTREITGGRRKVAFGGSDTKEE